MTVTAKCLVEVTQLTNAETSVYTATKVTAILDKVTATNVSGSAATITCHVVASGGTAGSTNAVVNGKTLQANETYGFPELVGQVLNQGDFLSVLAGTGAALNFRVSGREVS